MSEKEKPHCLLRTSEILIDQNIVFHEHEAHLILHYKSLRVGFHLGDITHEIMLSNKKSILLIQKYFHLFAKISDFRTSTTSLNFLIFETLMSSLKITCKELIVENGLPIKCRS